MSPTIGSSWSSRSRAPVARCKHEPLDFDALESEMSTIAESDSEDELDSSEAESEDDEPQVRSRAPHQRTRAVSWGRDENRHMIASVLCEDEKKEEETMASISPVRMNKPRMTMTSVKKCDRCQQAYMGYGATCGTCRSAGKRGSVMSCTRCNTFSCGFATGTDLDPRNGYRNDWAAAQVSDPREKQMMRLNLGCRVIDGENVGHSYGREVRKRPGVYVQEGVIRAVDFFRRENFEVIVVCKDRPGVREEMHACKLDEGVEVVIADKTDDIIVAKHAQLRNCPIVSRDNFNEWKTDPRVSKELRSWLQETAACQIRWSWGTAGQFMPDFDLPRRAMRPPTRTAQDLPWGAAADPWAGWQAARD